MDYFSDSERHDAESIVPINQAVRTDSSHWEECYPLLLEIYRRIPADYQNQFEQDGVLYIKFWNEVEYEWYLETKNSDILVEPLPNAYPVCCYLLSIILIEQGKHDEALTVLARGLDLEPDHPILLCQMGMLGCQAGRAYADENLVRTAFLRYAQAFDSRAYNSPGQKARALRGMGYASIELNEWEEAERYYDASIAWQDSDNARQQLELLREKKKKPNTVVYANGSGFDKKNRPAAYADFHTKRGKLPKWLRENCPNVYVYFWSKAAKLYAYGPKVYQISDYFHYPLQEWRMDEIKAGSFQINNYLKGFHPDHALVGLSDVGLEQLLMTFHFAKETEMLQRNSTNQSIKKVWFRHVMDKSTIELYFLMDEEVVKPWWKIW